MATIELTLLWFEWSESAVELCSRLSSQSISEKMVEGMDSMELRDEREKLRGVIQALPKKSEVGASGA